MPNASASSGTTIKTQLSDQQLNQIPHALYTNSHGHINIQHHHHIHITLEITYIHAQTSLQRILNGGRESRMTAAAMRFLIAHKEEGTLTSAALLASSGD